MFSKIRQWMFNAVLAVGVLMALGTAAHASGGETDVSDITTALTDVTTLFGSIAALAVIVTGFFLGRKWFKRI